MLEGDLDRDSDLALHEQVAARVRRAIADGEALPGSRLPPAADLAAVLGVNRNTVLRALRVLRDEGTVDFRRGRGVHVTGTSGRSAVIALTRALVRAAQRQGFSRQDVATMVLELP